MIRRDAWTIWKKEVLETLRDPRTLLPMILVPVVLYPALILLMTQMAAVEHTRLDETTGHVAFHGGEPPSSLAEALGRHPQLALVADTKSSPPDLINSGAADCVVAIASESRRDFDRLEPIALVVHHDASSDLSRAVQERTLRALEKWLEEVREERLQDIPRGRHVPATIRQENVATPTRMGGHLLGQLVPLLLFATLVLGAFHPAVDLTAGEKERGTLLTLLTTPLSRGDIVLGKFGAVVTITLLAGMFNIGSLALFLGQAFPLAEASPELTLDLPLLRWVLLLVVVLAASALFSAVMLGVAITARGFKEAQALLTPVAFACLIPGVLATMPGTELGPFTAWIPSLNLALLAREILVGDASPGTFAVVLGSTALVTGGLLLFARFLFGRETVMVGGGTASAHGHEKKRIPGIGEGLAFFAILLALVLYIGLPLQLEHPLTGVLFTLWGVLFGGTWIAVRVRRWDVRETFRLRRASLGGWMGALLLGLGAWALVLTGVEYLQGEHLPITEDLARRARLLFETERGALGDALLLLAITVSPAICEEVVFRGVLLRSFRTALPTALAVILSAALFAGMHLSVHRMLATFSLGLLAGGIVIATGSLLPAILFHGVHNSIAYGLSTLDGGSGWVLDLNGQPTGTTLAGATLLVALGGALLFHESRRRSEDDGAGDLQELIPEKITDRQRDDRL